MKNHNKIQSHSYLNADIYFKRVLFVSQLTACPLEAPECAMTPHSRTLARETDRAAQSQDGDRRRMKFDEGNTWKFIE